MMFQRLIAKLLPKALDKAIAGSQQLSRTLQTAGDDVVKRVGFMLEAERLVASSQGKLPNEVFKDVDDDHWRWLNTEGYRRIPPLRKLLPALPPEHFQRLTNSAVGDETLNQAFSVYRLYRDLIEKHHGPVANCGAILDFGCGWGRVMRFFLRDIDPAKLWGIETSEKQVEQAKAT